MSTHVYIIYFDQIHPLYYFLIPPLLKKLLTGFILLFSYMCLKYPDHIHSSLSPFTLLLLF
jgi:hypothetical protein